ncbi:MAG: DUF4179 domain-containing protein [Peptostreptococcaceae bacterium]
MKIDDKEIDKLLEEFNSEEIKLPEILDEKLNTKLNELRPKKKNKFMKSLIASIVILVLSYSTIPGFKTFADNVFKYILGDIGIENAANNGYEKLPEQSLDINGYKIDIKNIYMDNLRITFDVYIKINQEMKYDEFGSETEQYSISIIDKELDEILKNYSWSTQYEGYNKNTKTSKSSVQLVGKSNNELLALKDEKIEINIELVKYYSVQKGEKWDQKKDILGKSKLLLNTPNELKESEFIEINKSIKEGRLNLDIQKLEISPTMMYLDTSGKLDEEYQIQGLYDFKITSDKNNTYKDSMTLSATVDEYGNTRQTIVPSIYYDKSKKYELKSEGVLVAVKEEVKINLEDIYPRTIDFFDSKITIKDVFYKDGKLTIETIRNKDVYSAGGCLIDGKLNGIEQYLSGDIEGFVFEVPEKEQYDFTLEMIMKYKHPINISLNR